LADGSIGKIKNPIFKIIFNILGQRNKSNSNS
jgi:hypothetical protein